MYLKNPSILPSYLVLLFFIFSCKKETPEQTIPEPSPIDSIAGKYLGTTYRKHYTYYWEDYPSHVISQSGHQDTLQDEFVITKTSNDSLRFSYPLINVYAQGPYRYNQSNHYFFATGQYDTTVIDIIEDSVKVHWHARQETSLMGESGYSYHTFGIFSGKKQAQ